MKTQILQQLQQIEHEHRVKILLAVESGSRAWGFASPDSDYDVRFLYVRPAGDYLRLEKTRDVIELPLQGELDINGWDLQKALRLLHQSNPTLFEWFSSPIVYQEAEPADEFRQLMQEYFSVPKSLYHYISMAEGNCREHLQSETVRAKKYFYVLRPVLACRWLLEKGTQPPMRFAELAGAELPAYLKSDVDRLLDLKMNVPEAKMIPRVDALNQYLIESFAELKAAVKQLPAPSRPGWEPLDRFFLSVLQR